MYDIITKGRLPNLAIECQLDLFDKIVKPILYYMDVKYGEWEITTLLKEFI